MKKYFMILVAALTVAIVSSCSSSDDDYDEMSSGVLRHWFAKGIAEERRKTLSTEV